MRRISEMKSQAIQLLCKVTRQWQTNSLQRSAFIPNRMKHLVWYTRTKKQEVATDISIWRTSPSPTLLFYMVGKILKPRCFFGFVLFWLSFCTPLSCLMVPCSDPSSHRSHHLKLPPPTFSPVSHFPSSGSQLIHEPLPRFASSSAWLSL